VGNDVKDQLKPDVIKVNPKPLIDHMYTADPSAHSINGKIFLYPSHDRESDIPFDDSGDQFDMVDYHVFSMDSIDGPVTDHGIVLDIKDVTWASKQMWAPDAASRNGKHYLYFPVKDKQDIFRLGVAVSDVPEGPFEPVQNPIAGVYSIDPAVFEDDDGEYYLFMGGLWGGQLQNWSTGEFSPVDVFPEDDEPALLPLMAKMNEDMISISEDMRPLEILDEQGELLLAGDNSRRYFEGPWMHKHNDTYYFSYSTGDTHNIAYATSDSPYGPFTHRGVLLNPVVGWTNHHSTVNHNGEWFLFFHDSSLSGGKTHLRNVKAVKFEHNDDGTITTIDALAE
jgi:beta-xylosidase